MNIKNTREFNYLMYLYAMRDNAQKMYEDYVMKNENLKWYQIGERKWCKHMIHKMRKIVEGWDLMISINARRLVELIKDEGE